VSRAPVRFLAFLLLVGAVPAAIAAQDAAPAEDPSGCARYDAAPPESLPAEFLDVFAAANGTGMALCRAFWRAAGGIEDGADPDASLQAFVAYLAGVVPELFPRELGMTPMAPHVDRLGRQLALGGILSKSLPRFEVNGRAQRFGFAGTPAAALGRFDRNDPACEQRYRMDCGRVLEAFGTAVNRYQVPYRSITAGRTEEQLGALAAHWDAYLDRARSQTLPSLLFTTLMERRHFAADHLVGPPPRQWFLLQPGVVYGLADTGAGNVDASIGVAVDWVGVNGWDLDPVPLGLSLTSVVLDYDGIDDIGHGFTVHVDNRYSIGWARHGSEDTIFLSFDLLTLVQDRGKQFEAFARRMGGRD
jgi:hypothetical protein